MVTGMEKPYVVGMDIGGTNTVFGIVDSRGNVLATDSVKTQSFSKIEDYVEAVSSKLRPLIESFGGVEKIKGMGVGAPNGNYYNGTIEFAPNLPWKGVIPLAALFEEAIGVPTALTNDANAAAIGEMTYGAARGMKDFIMITLGTGVGSGIVINGQLVYGHDGFAGELGHVIVRRDGRQCGCGRKGCLETYCSATGVARTAREFLVARPEPSLLRDIPAEDIVSKDVFDAAGAFEPFIANLRRFDVGNGFRIFHLFWCAIGCHRCTNGRTFFLIGADRNAAVRALFRSLRKLLFTEFAFHAGSSFLLRCDFEALQVPRCTNIPVIRKQKTLSFYPHGSSVGEKDSVCVK